jgi:hypothetical protein
MTTRRMEAEIVTDKPDPIIKKLTELGFELEVIVWPDDAGTTIVATMLTDLEEVAFLHHVDEIVDPLEGTVMEAGIVWQPSLIQKPGVVKRRFVSRYRRSSVGTSRSRATMVAGCGWMARARELRNLETGRKTR